MLRYYFEGYADTIRLATTLRNRPWHEASANDTHSEPAQTISPLRRLWLAISRRITPTRSL